MRVHIPDKEWKKNKRKQRLKNKKKDKKRIKSRRKKEKWDDEDTERHNGQR